MGYFPEEPHVWEENTMPPYCNANDILYRVKADSIIKIKIVKVIRQPLGHYVYKDDTGYSYLERTLRKTCFKTEEEAKEMLRTKKVIAEKRKRLREYEAVLNKELNITNHVIIK